MAYWCGWTRHFTTFKRRYRYGCYFIPSRQLICKLSVHLTRATSNGECVKTWVRWNVDVVNAQLLWPVYLFINNFHIFPRIKRVELTIGLICFWIPYCSKWSQCQVEPKHRALQYHSYTSPLKAHRFIIYAWKQHYKCYRYIYNRTKIHNITDENW
jgi:hypothetical protein